MAEHVTTNESGGIATDRVDSGRYMMFVRKPVDMNADMVWDRLWFMIKNSDEETDIDMVAAWADMWVMKTHKGCVYLEEHMAILAEMEKGLYV